MTRGRDPSGGKGRGTRRWLAIALGVAAGLCVVGWLWIARDPSALSKVLPQRMQKAMLSTDIAHTAWECPTTDDVLLFSHDQHRQLRTNRLIEKRIDSSAGKATAEFSDGWAEQHHISFQIRGDRLTVATRYTTDYGDFNGNVGASESRVHIHEDALCFDLLVDRLDNSFQRERWLGRIALR